MRSASNWSGANPPRSTSPRSPRCANGPRRRAGCWILRLAPDAARAAVATVTGGAAFAALDDFTLATPSLEDVYLALGGATEGLVKA